MSLREAPSRSGASKAPKDTEADTKPVSALPRPKFGDLRSADGETVAPSAAGNERTKLQPAAGPEETAVLPAAGAGTAAADGPEDPVTARERRRTERDRALGTRRRAPEQLSDEPVVEQQAGAPVIVRNTDRFFGSLGLFLLRVVAAAIIGLHGFAKALDIQSVQAMLANTVIPEPVIMSFVLTGAEVAIALALLFGLFTRVAGLGLAAIGIGALVFVHWVTNPFAGNALSGELELLLAGVGLLFLFVGAGGWSVDAAFRRRRSAEAV
ncbi:DoxX family protein [Granulicoccus sp. GXG6511]|uniref:DoxX family protein n=1 Tax=Granulicoccus sp. GXG6511 TaxID=3381351 RepID=UPI003D7E4D29